MLFQITCEICDEQKNEQNEDWPACTTCGRVYHYPCLSPYDQASVDCCGLFSEMSWECQACCESSVLAVSATHHIIKIHMGKRVR